MLSELLFDQMKAVSLDDDRAQRATGGEPGVPALLCPLGLSDQGLRLLPDPDQVNGFIMLPFELSRIAAWPVGLGGRLRGACREIVHGTGPLARLDLLAENPAVPAQVAQAQAA